MSDAKGKIGTKNVLRELYRDYKGELLFFVILAAAIVISHWLSRGIPVDSFDRLLTPVQNAFATTFCFFGAWLMFAHSEGLRIRKIWGLTLLIWGLFDTMFLVLGCLFHVPILNIGADALNAFELLIGNLMGWLFVMYPTETLRPGWLTFKRAMMQLLPLFALVGLNYLLPINLNPLISMFPVVLGLLLLSHIRAYRKWCEDNFSSMDFIDVQWVMRYMIMLVLIGCSFIYMYISTNPTRAFTQQWLLVFFLIYSTEQILFRRDPWQELRSSEDASLQKEPVAAEPQEQVPEPETETEKLSPFAAQRKQLEEWMETEKPYLSPEFRLMDIGEELQMNRTYLSQMINTEYGCSFYQFVNRYRINEAKRLLREQPYLTMQQVATLSGFSSRIVFSNAFSKEMGVSPREWSKQCNNS